MLTKMITTRAALVRKKDDPFEIVEGVEVHALGPTDMRIHMVASGICHSDEERRKGNGGIFPIIVGHEGAGIVEEIGPEVTDFEVGDHVALSFYADGTCPNCRKGKPSRCINFTKNNGRGLRPDGDYLFKYKGENVGNLFNESSFTETTVVNQLNAIKVDKDLDLRILGPLGCGYVTGAGTVFNAFKPEVGDGIVIFGTGAVGLGALMAAKVSGCTKIIAVDIIPERLELAKELGATHVINSKEEDPVAKVKELTDQLGVEWSIDTTGIPAVIQQGIDVLMPGGVTAPLAVTQKKTEIATINLVYNDKTVTGVKMGASVPRRDIPRLIELYKQGQFPFDKTIKFYDFEDINQANADSNSGKTIKPVLVIDKNYVPGK